jgi:hypothetical protein
MKIERGKFPEKYVGRAGVWRRSVVSSPFCRKVRISVMHPGEGTLRVTAIKIMERSSAVQRHSQCGVTPIHKTPKDTYTTRKSRGGYLTFLDPHVLGLPDTHPLVRGMDLDPDPDPDSDPSFSHICVDQTKIMITK